MWHGEDVALGWRCAWEEDNSLGRRWGWRNNVAQKRQFIEEEMQLKKKCGQWKVKCTWAKLMKGWDHTEDIFQREDWAKEKNDHDGNIVLYQWSSSCLYWGRSMDVNIVKMGWEWERGI
jgi:hypothetical protein